MLLPGEGTGEEITLRYIPDFSAITKPPVEPDVALNARRTVCSQPSTVSLFGTVYGCRTCQDWVMVHHCSDRSRPSTCSNEYVPSGAPRSECGTAPDWLVAQ